MNALRHLGRRVGAWLGRGLLLWLLLLLVGAGGWIFSTAGESPRAAAPASAWGDEALHAWGEDLTALSPVAPANACGLGASSCFKCHNGKRAPSPSLDVRLHPWHVDHQAVNYSCAGCHQGNPRILKQEIAHEKLVAQPLAAPEKTCATCHNPAQVESFTRRYQQVLNGGPQS